MTTLCANHGQQLVAVFLLTALAFGGCVQPQLQQGTTTTTHSRLIQQRQHLAAHNEPLPYPAAGYRPKIPFDLPRQPKVLFASTTTTTTTSMPTLMAPTEEIYINIETVDQTTATTTMSTHIPAQNYGTPNNFSNVTNVHVKVNLPKTEVINAPCEYFQPPLTNAAKNFNTAELNNTLDTDIEADVNVNVDVDVDDENNVSQVLVAASNDHNDNDNDVVDDESLFSVEPQPKLNVFNRRFEFERRQIPASTYGVPNPDIGSNMNSHTSQSDTVMTNANFNSNEIPLELELNESENELAKIFIPNSNSIHLSASNEAFNRLSALKTERLILLPADNAPDILRQIYLANFANIKREH